ncbi:MAG: hypothetical protein HY939_01940 [Gammaproteobacteria bacterium]|nr:hypothetical protein [Gammaproteobacteria bacterium]
MLNPLEVLLRDWPKPYLTDTDIVINLRSSVDSRYSRVKRALAASYLLPVRKGLYLIGEKLRGKSCPVNPYELAVKIYAPSVVSLESALSYHGLIPEAVYTVSSVCVKRKKTYSTPVGQFSYQTVPPVSFYEEVERISDNNSEFFMAKPWRAICDYIYCNKLDWRTVAPLAQSLRIDVTQLPPLSEETRQALMRYYKSKRIILFLAGVKDEH